MQQVSSALKENPSLPAENPYTTAGSLLDVFHANSVELLDRPIDNVAEEGNVLICIRELNLVAIIDIDNENHSEPNTWESKEFRPKTRQELLALDLAQAFGDYEGLALYLSYAKKYPEALLRKVLGEVKEVPTCKIKKSRGALFNYLVQKYAKDS